jgi:ZIP family zinc transporter
VGIKRITHDRISLPVLAVFMTVAISIHNVPEGVAVLIPLRAMDISEWRMVWWAVFSSLPQPLGAVLAYYFVTLAEAFLPGGGRRELVGGMVAGVVAMVPLAFV